MKTILVTLLMVFVWGCQSFANSGLTASREFTKANASAATPVVLAPAQTWFKKATILGKKSARVNNTGTVYLGTSSANDAQPIAIAPGEEIVIEAPEGEWLDFNAWYLDVVTADDAVMVVYTW